MTESKASGIIECTDECVNDTALREYYCASTGEGTARIYDCLYGGEEGKCKIASCSDTDNGRDYSVKGTLSEFKEGGETDAQIADGILIYDYAGKQVSDNVIENNIITGFFNQEIRTEFG